MVRLDSPALAVGVLGGLLCGVAGCHRPPRSPQEARDCVAEAARASDGVSLYKCLDQRTRWAIDSTYRDQSVARSLISARYAEDTAAAALAPLEAAAEPDAPRFFNLAFGAPALHQLAERAAAPGTLTTHDDRAEFGAGPSALHFARDGKWWGLSDFGDLWTQRQEHADHELKTVRENLKLLDKADPK